MRMETVTGPVIFVIPFSWLVLRFPPAAQLQTVGAERPALGVGGGPDAAATAGRTWELPAGPAPVQLPAPVRAPHAHPPRVAILPVLVPWEIPPPQCTFSNDEEPRVDGGNHRLLRAHLTTWQGDLEGGVLGDAHTFTRQLPHWTWSGLIHEDWS